MKWNFLLYDSPLSEPEFTEFKNFQNFTNKMENKTMKKQLTKLVLTAALGLALTFTFNACDEKQAAKNPTEPAAAAATQEASQEVAADTKPPETASESQPSEKKECAGESTKTIEAVFLRGYEGSEGYLLAFRLANGDEITLDGEVPDNVKEGDKVSVNVKVTKLNDSEMGCVDFMNMISLKKIGK